MNDFTKEELILFKYLVDEYCKYMMPPSGVYGRVYIKIQRMIDEYEEVKND